jgi:hypothetical protein
MKKAAPAWQLWLATAVVIFGCIFPIPAMIIGVEGPIGFAVGGAFYLLGITALIWLLAQNFGERTVTKYGLRFLGFFFVVIAISKAFEYFAG